jgi:hypothetical protein
MALPADDEKCANGHLFQEIARNAGGRLSETATSRGFVQIAPAGDITSGKATRTCGDKQDNFARMTWKAREEICVQEVSRVTN